MLKVISLLKRKESMSLEAFRRWALEEHPPLGKQLPGIRHYRMSVVLEDNPDLPADAVSEFWFDFKFEFITESKGAFLANESEQLKAATAGQSEAGEATFRANLSLQRAKLVEAEL